MMFPCFPAAMSQIALNAPIHQRLQDCQGNPVVFGAKGAEVVVVHDLGDMEDLLAHADQPKMFFAYVLVL